MRNHDPRSNWQSGSANESGSERGRQQGGAKHGKQEGGALPQISQGELAASNPKQAIENIGQSRDLSHG